MKNRNLNEKSIVAVVPCETYDAGPVYEAMKAGIDAIGGIRKFVDVNEKILVKPNFLYALPVEKAATTHPAVIEAMFRILKEEGFANVKYGDSPGHGTSEGVAKKGGIHLAAAEYGIEGADMETVVQTSFPEGVTAKHFDFAKGVVDADAVINLCKMKTHALERITGGMKNVYGFIGGLNKAKGHVTYPNANAFARMLADIHRCIDVRLHVLDGIMAMEGNGPASGVPVPMKVLLFSDDPVAMDTVFCKLVYLDAGTVPTNVQGHAMGIGNIEEEKIEVRLVEIPEPAVHREANAGDDVREPAEQAEANAGDDVREPAEQSKANAGDDIRKPAVQSGANAGDVKEYRVVSFKELQEKFGNPNFDVDREEQRKTWLSQATKMFTKLGKRPSVKDDLCIKCGICVDHCPVDGKAIDFKRGKDKPPVYNYRKCIRCYCCQEMCPQHAIVVKK